MGNGGGGGGFGIQTRSGTIRVSVGRHVLSTLCSSVQETVRSLRFGLRRYRAQDITRKPHALHPPHPPPPETWSDRMIIAGSQKRGQDGLQTFKTPRAMDIFCFVLFFSFAHVGGGKVWQWSLVTMTYGALSKKKERKTPPDLQLGGGTGVLQLRRAFLSLSLFLSIS